MLGDEAKLKQILRDVSGGWGDGRLLRLSLLFVVLMFIGLFSL